MEPIQRKRFRKYQKNIHNPKKNNLLIYSSGRYALQSSENLYIHPKTLEAIRRLFTRCLRRKGRVTITIAPNYPVSKKGTESRMGKGKGGVYEWLCRIGKGEIFLEIDGIGKKNLKDIRDITKKIPTKFPGKIKEIFHPNLERKDSSKKLSLKEKNIKYYSF